MRFTEKVQENKIILRNELQINVDIAVHVVPWKYPELVSNQQMTVRILPYELTLF